MMCGRRIALGTIMAALLALAACATSPEDEQRRIDMEADIDEIMSYELDKTDFGEAKSCLSKSEYQSFRALGDRHLLFYGRSDKLWVNVLRGRCTGLRDDSAFILDQTSANRTCDMDRFEVVDRSLMTQGFAGTGATCVLGEFRPVAKAQLEEIETRLEMR